MYRYRITAGVKRAFFLLFMIGLTGLCSAATRYGDILVQVTTSAAGESSFGYVDYQVTISNSGPDTHTVKLILPQGYHGYGNCIRELVRQVTVPAGSAASVSLFQPPLPMQGDGAAVVIDGTYQRDQIQLPMVNHCQDYYYYYGASEKYCVLLSRQIGFDDVNNELEEFFGIETGKSSSYMNNTPYSLALSELPVADWSQNWLSYTRYNGILLTASEWQRLTDSVRGALLEYVRCGGCLTVVGQADLNGEFSSFGRTTSGLFQVYYPGFGVLLTTDRDDVTEWTSVDWNILKDCWKETSQNLQNVKSVKEANDWFPVIDNLSIPVRGLLLIVLIFAILIGPVNLFVLTRKKRQILLLWTVPLLSLIASVIVFGYATFAEGWTGYTRIQSLTILDGNANLASTVGVAAFYCPLTPRDGLHFDYETECTPQIDRYGTSGVQGRKIDWTEDQHLTSGWVASRVPVHFKVRKSQMRREKIVFSKKQLQHCEALNGFGVAVEALYYADADGTMYHAEDIPAGEKVSMQPMDTALSDSAASPMFARMIFEKDWHAAVDEIIKKPTDYLRPNCYIAIVKEPLFMEQALRKQKSEIVESVIYGISQETADAG